MTSYISMKSHLLQAHTSMEGLQVRFFFAWPGTVRYNNLAIWKISHGTISHGTSLGTNNSPNLWPQVCRTCLNVANRCVPLLTNISWFIPDASDKYVSCSTVLSIRRRFYQRWTKLGLRLHVFQMTQGPHQPRKQSRSEDHVGLYAPVWIAAAVFRRLRRSPDILLWAACGSSSFILAGQTICQCSDEPLAASNRCFNSSSWIARRNHWLRSIFTHRDDSATFSHSGLSLLPSINRMTRPYIARPV